MKKMIIASILTLGLAAGVAFAHNNGYGPGQMMGGNGSYGMMGPDMMGGNYGMMGGGYGMGPGMMSGYAGGYTDCPGAASFGKDGWNSESYQKFLEETVGLRKELNDKRFDFIEAQRSPDTTREQLATLEKEMIDIRTKLQEKAEQYR